MLSSSPRTLQFSAERPVSGAQTGDADELAIPSDAAAVGGLVHTSRHKRLGVGAAAPHLSAPARIARESADARSGVHHVASHARQGCWDEVVRAVLGGADVNELEAVHDNGCFVPARRFSAVRAPNLVGSGLAVARSPEER
jgi:hypothetical protein